MEALTGGGYGLASTPFVFNTRPDLQGIYHHNFGKIVYLWCVCIYTLLLFSCVIDMPSVNVTATNMSTLVLTWTIPDSIVSQGLQSTSFAITSECFNGDNRLSRTIPTNIADRRSVISGLGMKLISIERKLL